ncbi:MAG: 50S ribosomal protein L11 methyltransferase [Eubacteriales bacterium]|nr:50S ribosomal protein L11 methyltransferase [Eubacteriales bacterium]
MNWIEATVFTTSEGIEPVTGRLYQLGITGVSIEDETDFNDFLENNKNLWDYVDEELSEKMRGETKVKFYVPESADGVEMLSAVINSLAEMKQMDSNTLFGRLDVDTGSLREEDWANNWKQYFHTLEIGDRIVVQPEWEEYNGSDDKIVFRINPGMSFGTGSHHTTKMCIEALDATIKEGISLLDLGSGSGILSLISILLGAKNAFAVDIDPLAVDISYQNAELNGISKDSFTAKAGNVLDDESLRKEILSSKYDVVTANIVADVIIPLIPLAYQALNDDGTFITSGIIEDRINDVKCALEDGGFYIIETKRSADWAAFICKKK